MKLEDTRAVQVQVSGIVPSDNLYGVQLKVEFDKTRLKVRDADAKAEGVQVKAGPLLLPSNPAGILWNEAKNDQGVINYVVTLVAPDQPPKEGGVLMTVEFECTAPGEATISMPASALLLANWDGEELKGIQLQVSKTTIACTSLPAQLTTISGAVGSVPGYCSELTLSISSASGIGSVQLTFDIPAGGTFMNSSAEGFLLGASYQFSGTQHTWTRLNIQGEKTGSLKIVLRVPKGKKGNTFGVTLQQVSLKDTSGYAIPLITEPPYSYAFHLKRPTVQQELSEVLEAYQGKKSSKVTCGEVPQSKDVFGMLDEFFGD